MLAINLFASQNIICKSHFEKSCKQHNLKVEQRLLIKVFDIFKSAVSFNYSLSLLGQSIILAYILRLPGPRQLFIAGRSSMFRLRDCRKERAGGSNVKFNHS